MTEGQMAALDAFIDAKITVAISDFSMGIAEGNPKLTKLLNEDRPKVEADLKATKKKLLEEFAK